MSPDPKTCYCENCRKEVPFHCNPVNHVKQLLLTIATVGIWLPVWLCMIFLRGKICDGCGQPLWGK